ncbi:MAG TPA: UbiX family flavin prenyltransferase [Arenicellales bacterium]|jgi:4-hydroxy-3-polyprenylbenzoate decarboxylase|nr:3-octaprenyl-4-hydroxybenzoate carboxy-lyase [Acidiferrobacteraceae bacterium]MDP6135954.1 UbiX family flavin prenyltransferase [Arenicellales bacterium]MDP7219489.1 UbiX family flavin prenyltransferase [Arenicellales bacterium]HCF72193.1 3-octaprenyl-4-hydroxybenzoate carboxy-lyase [Gammaproteobacteria bacterium]HJP09135.1 UbiX family flavin prenyltransferase [Arenicellales bacterium]|tara:strand:+ start:1645 stop:2244 length:600 start_codon:yes stop_codon:yes gene_type:complete
MNRRLIVGISGASGAIYGIRLLEVLQGLAGIETHLVVSHAAKRTILLETDHSLQQVESLAGQVFGFNDIAACVSSGSYQTLGMVIIPCSIKTLSGVAQSYADNLLVRAADVVLKEQRKLVLVLRETPLHLGHTRLMSQAIEIGATLLPAMPAFYHRPLTIDDLVNQTVNRVLDQFDIELPEDLFARWQGPVKFKTNTSA